MLVILLNCVTLGMFQPCQDLECHSDRCSILQAFDDFIFAFFAVEMVVKMVALGIFGQRCYLGDTWNRLDFFIVMAGMLEYSLDGHNVSFSAIRTVRVLRPLRAINRVPSMRILVTLLLDTLPMLGNVLLLCFFVFFIFGIVGVQLWAGLLRNRCFLDENAKMQYNLSFLSPYFKYEEMEDIPFICSTDRENGMQRCSDVPHLKERGANCQFNGDYIAEYGLHSSAHNGCVNWNQYYNNCRASDVNPHNGAISFDNIGYAWIAIFQVITLEGWVDIMYDVMDAHSFYNFIYFIFLIIVGSFFMINLCLVVIATQFSETKQRENQLMKEQRTRFRSNESTLASFAEPGSCYEEMLKYISHLCRKFGRHANHLYGYLCSRHPGKSTNHNGQAVGGSINGHWSLYSGVGVDRVCACVCEECGVSLTTSDIQEVGDILAHSSDNDSDPGKKSKSKPGQHLRSPTGKKPTWNQIWDSEQNPSQNWFKNCILKIRSKLRCVVDSKYFNRGIMIAILINTLSMGVEHHEQPAELTDVLEISNIVFTSMFALEMLLKLLAYGLYGYISNPYNIFDGIIVIISVWEIIGQADGGFSVLRTFRLLRVLKLVRFLPALRRQLVVLMKTMDNVATFCMLLMLFIFIFSILGMHLFGCKFTLRLENGDTVSDRKNFDSLLWAIVTVFQILTQEDWNVVLYNGMASTTPWAALYFVALMTFGNYVLFNLLVAILVEGFQAEGDASRSDIDDDGLSSLYDDEEKLRELLVSGPEVKMQTLMPIPNGCLEPRAAMPPQNINTHSSAYPRAEHTLIYSQSRRSSITSNDPNGHTHDQRSLSSLWGSRRSSWNSLGHAPSLKRRGQSDERESLLSGEGHSSSDEEQSEGGKSSRTGSMGGVSRLESLDYPEFLQVPVTSHSYMECNGGLDYSYPPSPYSVHSGTALPDLQQRLSHTGDEEPQEENWSFRLKRMLEPYKPQWCRDHEDWSLYLFSPHNEFRMRCQKALTHKMFDHVVLIFIFLNCITIALERPHISSDSMERIFLNVSNYIFTVIFVTEMTLKVVAMGLYVGPDTYLKSSWNVLDGLLVFVSLVDILFSLASSGGNRILGILRVLRLLRTLRPLRVISRAPGLKLVVETLITSLRPIGNIVLICCAFFIVFGILGVQLFKGKFYHCEGFDTRNITNKSECVQANYRWVRRKYNFDNLGQALMTLFVLASKDGWVNIMYDGLDAVAVDQQPVRNHNPWMLLYFISFLLIVSFFVLNMFVGVVVENFHKCRQDQEEEEARLREERRQRRMEKKRRKALQRPYYADYSPARLYIHTVCTSHYLDLFITVIITINVITMSMEHYNQPKYLEEALKYCNYVFTFVFVIEAVLKLIAFGLRRFFKERWNQLDLAIVLLSIMGITLEEIDLNASLPINPTIIRIMRVLRIARVLKLLKMAKGMRSLLDTVVQALPQVGNLGLLFMLLFFIYAALGVELFGKLKCSDESPCEGLSKHANFENFGIAFLTLFRVSTGDNWNGIMKDTLKECRGGDGCLSYLPLLSPLYFVTFVLIAQFVLVNVVVAVLMKHLEESNKEAREEAEMEAEIKEELQMGRRQSNASRGGATGSENIATYDDSRHGNLLSVSRPPVTRMLSLPNDSYMFHTVRPGRAQYSRKESMEQNQLTGSAVSVSSQPCEHSSTLQDPGTLSQPGPASSSELHPLAQTTPFRGSKALKTLRRQEAIKMDSIDCGSKDNLFLPTVHHSSDSLLLTVPSTPTAIGSAPCSPHSTPRLPPRGRTASVHTPGQMFSQRSIPHWGPQHTHISHNHTNSDTDKCTPNADTHVYEPRQNQDTDEADEEVRQITSSTQSNDCSQHGIYSHAPSCYAPPCSVPDSQSGSLQGCGGTKSRQCVRGLDLMKSYSVDTHSYVVLPPGPYGKSKKGEELLIQQPVDEPKTLFSSSNGQPTCLLSRKEKMSPPCISVDSPVDTDHQSLSSNQRNSNILRRRTTSFDSALPQDSLEIPDAFSITETHPQAESRLSGHLPLPQLSFDQSDVDAMSSLSDLLSDSDQSAHSLQPEAQSESKGSGKAVVQTPPRKRGLMRMGSTRNPTGDECSQRGDTLSDI
ncbi:voltage-dependent T-type calcium channel subunit alpha-1H [Chanos chanos]|uniref:Voltage-dependent T-type calcium channel subunit alpha n=1 Tax=Chanos chanos TaxID=29144 RepID=A0A6J2VS42_CHACN|nr:voltage-dependent T-type calcium channel subunit alpha-1H-like [Chanos chanos]